MDDFDTFKQLDFVDFSEYTWAKNVWGGWPVYEVK